jgi:excisionase family DNA binding protein
MHNRLLALNEVCARLGIRRSTLYRLISESQIAVLKIGRRTLIDARAVDAFIDELSRGARR